MFPDYLPTSYDDYVSTDNKHWHITIEQLMQTAHIYTLSVAQHNQLTTNDATIFIINAVICYSNQSIVPKLLRNLFRGNSRKCLNHSFAQ